jgi:hypothetical protein
MTPGTILPDGHVIEKVLCQMDDLYLVKVVHDDKEVGLGGPFAYAKVFIRNGKYVHYDQIKEEIRTFKEKAQELEAALRWLNTSPNACMIW